MSTKRRFDIIKGMNEIIKSLNDETAYYQVWIFTVPDEADDEDLMDIAENEDLFKDAVDDFFFCMKNFAKHGLYIDNTFYENRHYETKKEEKDG